MKYLAMGLKLFACLWFTVGIGCMVWAFFAAFASNPSEMLPKLLAAMVAGTIGLFLLIAADVVETRAGGLK